MEILRLAKGHEVIFTGGQGMWARAEISETAALALCIMANAVNGEL